jgi:hypothetical protein
VMIGFAQPAGSRGTWRSDGGIDYHDSRSRRIPSLASLPDFLPSSSPSGG